MYAEKVEVKRKQNCKRDGWEHKEQRKCECDGRVCESSRWKNNDKRIKEAEQITNRKGGLLGVKGAILLCRIQHHFSKDFCPSMWLRDLFISFHVTLHHLVGIKDLFCKTDLDNRAEKHLKINIKIHKLEEWDSVPVLTIEIILLLLNWLFKWFHWRLYWLKLKTLTK